MGQRTCADRISACASGFDALASTSRMVRSLRALEGALLDNSMRYIQAPGQVEVSDALDAETGWFRRQ